MGEFWTGGRGTGANRTPQKPTADEGPSQDEIDELRCILERPPSAHRTAAQCAADGDADETEALWAAIGQIKRDLNGYGSVSVEIVDTAEREVIMAQNSRAAIANALTEHDKQNRAALDAQAATIDELQAGIRNLGARVREMEDAGNYRLGERVVKLEAQAKRVDRLQDSADIRSEWMAVVNADIIKLEDFRERVVAKFPSVGEPTIAAQCKAVDWRPPTEEENGE